jgi:hypothetical protein
MSKLNIVPVDTERLASRLLDAINSFKRVAIPGVPAAAVEEEHIPVPRVLSWTEEEQPRHELEPVEGAASYISTNRPLGPRRHLKDLIRPDSNSGEEAPEKVPAVENDETWERPEPEFETQPRQNEIIEEFSLDGEVLRRLQVTSQELHALSRVSMLGTLASKQDLLFMLRQIREATEQPAELEETVGPEPVNVQEEKAATSAADMGEIAAKIRREAHARLVELESTREVESRRREPVWRRVNARLGWRNSLSLSLRTR